MSVGKKTLSQAVTGLAVEDGVLKGLSRSAAPRADGGSVAIVPGRMGCQVAFARPHLVEAAGKELREAHEGIGRERRVVRISRGGGARARQCRRRIDWDSSFRVAYQSGVGSRGATAKVGTN